MGGAKLKIKLGHPRGVQKIKLGHPWGVQGGCPNDMTQRNKKKEAEDSFKSFLAKKEEEG